MAAEMAARAIQLILAPVVMVSACALLLNGLLARYAAVNDRLRALAHERFALWRTLGERPVDTVAPPAVLERLGVIDVQVPLVLQHHRLLRDATLVAYCALLLFVACMVLIAALVMTTIDWLAAGVLGLFLGGTMVLLLSVGIAASEVRTSHRAVRYELSRVLGRPPLDPGGRPATPIAPLANAGAAVDGARPAATDQ